MQSNDYIFKIHTQYKYIWVSATKGGLTEPGDVRIIYLSFSGCHLSLLRFPNLLLLAFNPCNARDHFYILKNITMMILSWTNLITTLPHVFL